ncbi:MAG TPA: hypothetical protein VE975_08810 [Actinomycetota bacterium]|jgi:hypothetical protein|nr:hypothetical protein [Actinomycetota bacterium]
MMATVRNPLLIRALSVFLFVVAGGLRPAFGTLVNRAVGAQRGGP